MIRFSYVPTDVTLRGFMAITKRIARVAFITILFASGVMPSRAATACAPPSGFKDTAHPQIGSAEQFVSHTEEIVIARPFSVVSAAMSKPLNKTIGKSTALPGVSGDFMLTPGSFGAPGSRHLVCLTDGGTTEEEAINREQSEMFSRFRYVVWNYQTPKARPVAYGVGEFRTIRIDSSHTKVTWTYSFKLKEDVFPGDLGAAGRFLFRVGFLDRDYAAMMRTVLNGYKADAEALTRDQ